MSGPRARRAARLVEIRARTVNLLEVELAGLVRRTTEAANLVKAAHETWRVAASAPGSACCSSTDLAEMHAYFFGLCRRIDSLMSQERQARQLEEVGRRKLLDARKELKKMETFRDHLLETAQAEENALERKATDEVAARIARNP